MARFPSQVTKTKFPSNKEHEPAQVCIHKISVRITLSCILVHGNAWPIKFLAPKCDPFHKSLLQLRKNSSYSDFVTAFLLKETSFLK